MFTRRTFLRSAGTATAFAGLASIREGGIERILAASRSAGDASPDKVAAEAGNLIECTTTILIME